MDIRSLKDHVGLELGVSEWLDVSQSRIDRFAAATDDAQWIHVDVARAAASPAGTTIAHGFLTLALTPALLRQAIAFSNVAMAINYGVNRVRFMSPVASGARIRGRFTVVAVHDVDDGVQVTWAVIVEREHGDKPCCVAEWVVRYYFSP